MQIGMVGLGKMGRDMVRRLLRGGHECVVTDLSQDNVKKLAGGSSSCESCALPSERVFFPRLLPPDRCSNQYTLVPTESYTVGLVGGRHAITMHKSL